MSAEGALPTRVLQSCPGCGGASLAPLPLRYEFQGARFPMVECRDCGLRFLAVQPAPEAIAALYDAAYFEEDYRCGRGTSDSFSEEAFRTENRGLLEDFAALRESGRLLEVGCAAGWLLKHARERGWEVRGVELSAEAVDHARALGLEVFQGDLVAAGLPGSYFDLVYMGDVLEHVPNCRAVLAEVARVLKPAGYLFLRGPITTNSLARRLALRVYRLIGRDIVLGEPPYHLLEFTPRSLHRLLGNAGLAPVRLSQSKIPPGRPHGEKTPLQRAAMQTLDAVNLPLTRIFNILGDRVVVVAQKR